MNHLSSISLGTCSCLIFVISSYNYRYGENIGVLYYTTDTNSHNLTLPFTKNDFFWPVHHFFPLETQTEKRVKPGPCISNSQFFFVNNSLFCTKCQYLIVRKSVHYYRPTAYMWALAHVMCVRCE